MNNKEETTPNTDQEQKIDNVDNNGVDANPENNLEKKIEELNDKLLRSLARNLKYSTYICQKNYNVLL